MPEFEPNFESFEFLSPNEKENFIIELAMEDAKDFLSRYLASDFRRLVLDDETISGFIQGYFWDFMRDIDIPEKEKDLLYLEYEKAFKLRFSAGKQRRDIN